MGWWSKRAGGRMERLTGRLIVSPHATRGKREVVVVVHGEVSRSGEDLTSTEYSTASLAVVPDWEPGSECGRRCSCSPHGTAQDSTPYPGLACPPLAGRLYQAG